MHDDLDKLLIRRLDWRFLLETPALGRTLYLGSADGELAKALARFCSELVSLEAGDDPAKAALSRSIDLLVVTGDNFPVLNAAAPLLKPGASVYWELGRSARWALHRHPKSFAAQLTKAGFSDIRQFWFRPSFSDCREIIPLDDRVALRRAFAKIHENLVGRLKMLFGKATLISGVLPFIVPSFGLIAKLPQQLD